MAVAAIAPLLPVNVDSTMTPNNSITPSPPLLSHSSPPAPTLSLLHLSCYPQLVHILLPTKHLMSMQFRPYLNPTLSMTSWIMNMVLNYSLLFLLFEFAGLSPGLQGSNLLLARSGDRRTGGEQLSAPFVDSITNSTSIAYLSFPSSPALSTSSVSASSENGYENNSSRSEFS